MVVVKKGNETDGFSTIRFREKNLTPKEINLLGYLPFHRVHITIPTDNSGREGFTLGDPARIRPTHWGGNYDPSIIASFS